MTADAFEPLPPLFGRWVQDLLGRGAPREGRATCDECAMCARPGAAIDPQARYFDPSVKCCSYTPMLPNFIVGGVLGDSEPAAQPGRAALERRLAGRVAVTPLGVGPTPSEELLYREADDAFGRVKSLRCPYFVEASGRCGIWRQRNSVCATWFCKHERGNVGMAFWRGALQRFLGALEQGLARWCVLELDVGGDALAQLVDCGAWTGQPDALSAAALDRRVDDDEFARLWGIWRGREVEFYGRCADLMRPISLERALAIAGPEARAFAELTRDAFARLTSETLPGRLILGTLQITAVGPEMTRVATYNGYDPIDVPNTVMALLRAFDGRPTASVMAEIEARTGFSLQASLLVKLVDFGVLVETN